MAGNGQGLGYRLGGGGDKSRSLNTLSEKNLEEIQKFKEKEREKKMKKLEETVKKYSHLNISIGNKLGEEAQAPSQDDLDVKRRMQEVRMKQQQNYSKNLPT